MDAAQAREATALGQISRLRRFPVRFHTPIGLTARHIGGTTLALPRLVRPTGPTLAGSEAIAYHLAVIAKSQRLKRRSGRPLSRDDSQEADYAEAFATCLGSRNASSRQP